VKQQLKYSQDNSFTYHGKHQKGKATLQVIEKQAHQGSGMTGIK